MSASRLHVRDVEHVQKLTPVSWYPFCGNTTCWCMEPNVGGPCSEHKEHPTNPRCGECGWPEYRHTTREIEHVADYIRRILKRSNVKQVDLARETGLSPKHINQILQKNVAMSLRIALLFERHLGLDALTLMTMQTRWELHQLREAT